MTNFKRRVVLLSPSLAPPYGGIQRLAEDIPASRPAGEVFTVAVATQPRSTLDLRIVLAERAYVSGDPTTAARFSFAAYCEIHRRSPDLIHGLTWKAAVATLAPIRPRRIPLVLHCHGEELFRPEEGPGAKVRARVFEHAAQVIAVSRSTARQVEAMFGYRPVVIPPALSEWPQMPHRTVGSAMRVLSVGRLVPAKGHGLLLDALAALRASGHEVSLDLVGEGPEDGALRAKTSALGLLRRVTFHGRVSDERLERLYQECDCFALLSQPHGKEEEGFGIAFLEAAARGLPIVAGSAGGAPEAVNPGVSAFLAQDLASVVWALTQLSECPELRLRMGVAGRAFASGFRRESLGERLGEIYDEVLQTSSRRDRWRT